MRTPSDHDASPATRQGSDATVVSTRLADFAPHRNDASASRVLLGSYERRDPPRYEDRIFVLPRTHHGPAAGAEFGVVSRISRAVLLDFRRPVFGVRRRRERPVLGAPVPEAPVDKERESLLGEDHVWSDRTCGTLGPDGKVDPEPQTFRVKPGTNGSLETRVASAVRRHDSTPLVGYPVPRATLPFAHVSSEPELALGI